MGKSQQRQARPAMPAAPPHAGRRSALWLQPRSSSPPWLCCTPLPGLPLPPLQPRRLCQLWHLCPARRCWTAKPRRRSPTPFARRRRRARCQACYSLSCHPRLLQRVCLARCCWTAKPWQRQRRLSALQLENSRYTYSGAVEAHRRNIIFTRTLRSAALSQCSVTVQCQEAAKRSN